MLKLKFVKCSHFFFYEVKFLHLVKTIVFILFELKSSQNIKTYHQERWYDGCICQFSVKVHGSNPHQHTQIPRSTPHDITNFHTFWPKHPQKDCWQQNTVFHLTPQNDCMFVSFVQKRVWDAPPFPLPFSFSLSKKNKLSWCAYGTFMT